MNTLLIIFSAIFGLIIGSFLNCLAWRMYKEESIMGRSYCPSCRHQLNLSLTFTSPDFTLKDHHNKEFTLSELRGKKVLLSFHPLAWTKVCPPKEYHFRNVACGSRHFANCFQIPAFRYF